MLIKRFKNTIIACLLAASFVVPQGQILAQANRVDDFLVNAADQKVYTSEKAVSDRIREYLVARKVNYDIRVRLKMEKPDGTDDQRSKKMKKFMNDLFLDSFKVTDKPYEGDYLKETLKGYDSSFSGEWKNGYFEGTFQYSTPLSTTAAQEKKIDAAVKRIMGELALDGKSDYEKARAVYDYVCEHTVYDYGQLNNPTSDEACNAYGPLIKGKGICAGISVTIYRLMREAGLDCRYISTNTKEGSSGHAWNIVRVGELYYYVDATWDLDKKKANQPYDYFLKKDPFVNHGDRSGLAQKADFWAEHPMSTTDYPYEDQPEKTEDQLNTPSWPHLQAERQGIRITWEKDPNAESVQVFRREESGEMVQIGESYDGQFLDTHVKNKKIYTYALKAVKGSIISELSEENSWYYIMPPQGLAVASGGRKAVNVTWKKMKGVTGYQIRYSTKKDFSANVKTVTIKNPKITRRVFKKLKKKKYYFQIRSVCKVTGYTWYSAWSKTKSFRVR